MNDARWVNAAGVDISAYMKQVFHVQSTKMEESCQRNCLKRVDFICGNSFYLSDIKDLGIVRL